MALLMKGAHGKKRGLSVMEEVCIQELSFSRAALPPLFHPLASQATIGTPILPEVSTSSFPVPQAFRRDRSKAAPWLSHSLDANHSLAFFSSPIHETEPARLRAADPGS